MSIVRILVFMSIFLLEAGFWNSAAAADSASFTPPDVNVVSSGGELDYYSPANGAIANVLYGSTDYDSVGVIDAGLCGLSEVAFQKDLDYSISSASYWGFAGHCRMYPPSIGSTSGDYSIQAYTAELNNYWEQAITACNLSCLVQQ